MIIENSRAFDLMTALWFGYPLCCTMAWGKGLTMGRIDLQPKEMKNSGFIPCETCSKLGHQVLIDYITEHRICPVPFPDGHLDTSFDDWVKTMPSDDVARLAAEKIRLSPAVIHHEHT